MTRSKNFDASVKNSDVAQSVCKPFKMGDTQLVFGLTSKMSFWQRFWAAPMWKPLNTPRLVVRSSPWSVCHVGRWRRHFSRRQLHFWRRQHVFDVNCTFAVREVDVTLNMKRNYVDVDVKKFVVTSKTHDVVTNVKIPSRCGPSDNDTHFLGWGHKRNGCRSTTAPPLLIRWTTSHQRDQKQRQSFCCVFFLIFVPVL